MDSWLEIGFFVSWFLVGALMVNGSDTTDSTGSLFTKAFNLGHDQSVLSLSDGMRMRAFWIAVTLAVILVLRAIFSQKASSS
jgi:hypothetical protein